MMKWMTSIVDVIAVPDFSVGAWLWLRRPMEQFINRPFSETLSLLFEPLALLLVLTYGFGPHFGPVLGVFYPLYVAPGVAVITSLFLPYWESAFGVFGRLRIANFYGVALQSPLTAREIAVGEIIWGAIKGTVAGTLVLCAAAFMNWKESHGIFWTPFILFPTAMTSSALGVFFASRSRYVSTLMLIQGVLLAPVAFWSDTVFTVTHSTFSLFLLFSPVSHVARALRSVWLGQLSSEFFLYLSLSILVACLMTNLAVRDFEKKIKKLVP